MQKPVIIKAAKGVAVDSEDWQMIATKGVAVDRETGQMKAAKGMVINIESDED